MSLQFTRRDYINAVAILCCAAVAGGCASWQGPRIDPSGERIFLWPNETPSAILAPAPGIPTFAAPPAAPVIAPAPAIALPFGNVQAPPVYSDPPAMALPAAPAPANSWNPFAPPVASPPVITTPAPPGSFVPLQPTVPALPPPPVATVPIAPALAGGAPVIAAPLGAPVPAGIEFLRIAPAGIMAPVGSELVLKANICRADGSLAPNQRVEWGVERSGAGQFSDLGTSQQLGVFRWPWDTPQKIDPWYAIGSTALVPTVLYRPTPDPSDDVPIERGDAWVAVTSATEGTSLVTAYAPGLANYNRVTSTIYWVDAQWIFPPSLVVEPGRPHVLTTTVMRRTNGTPLAGWLVRYDVASGAALGYEGGNSVEVPTDAAGRASVEVSPVATGGGATTVVIRIIRPALTGPVGSSPRLEIGCGSATISWAAGGAPAPAISTPPAAAPITDPGVPPTFSSPPPPISTPPSTTPQPTLPSGPTPADPYTPPRDEPAAGQAVLDLQLRRSGPEQVGVGEFTSFDVTITNRGTGTARGILVQDRFDAGLRHPEAKPDEFAVKYAGVRDLPPGESATVPLTFQVVAGGIQCHEVTVTAEGAQLVKERGCITASQAALAVDVTGPRSRVVGEMAPFNIVIKNPGDVAASNVEVVIRFDPALEPVLDPATIGNQNYRRLPDGSIMLSIDRLEAGERRPFDKMQARCITPSNNACVQAVVTASGGVTSADDACVEILPLSSPAP